MSLRCVLAKSYGEALQGPELGETHGFPALTSEKLKLEKGIAKSSDTRYATCLCKGELACFTFASWRCDERALRWRQEKKEIQPGKLHQQAKWSIVKSFERPTKPSACG